MNAKKSQIKIDEISQLENRIKELELQNEELLETVAPKVNKHKHHFWRSFGVVFFITLSIVSFMLCNIASWTKNTLLDTETFVATLQPVISQPEVQATIQKEVTTQLFSNINVEEELKQALPENVAFLAGPLSAQVEGFVNTKVGEVLASDKAYDIWGASLTTVHSTLIGYIQDDTKDGVLSINDLYSYASQQLGSDSNLSFLLNKQLPDKIGTITIKEVTWLPEARTYVNILEKLPIVLLLTSIVSLGLAMLLAFDKRKALLWVVILDIVMMIATLIALAIGVTVIGDSVQPTYSAAAQAIYETITQPLKDRTIGYGVLLVVIAIITIATSNYPSFIKARKYFNDKLVVLANKVIPTSTLPDWLHWLPKNRTAITWTSFMLIFVGLGVRIPPVSSQIIDAFITATIVVFIEYIISICITATSVTHKK